MSAAVTAAVGMCLLAASPARAELSTSGDPAGDGQHGRRLDVTAIKVDNRDHAIVTTVSVVRLTAGDIGLRLRAQGKKRHLLAGVYSERYHGSQKDVLSTRSGAQECSGLVVRWNRDADRIRLRVPSTCWNGGDFGAVQVKVITELGGADADLAPNGPRGGWRWTEPTPRG